MKYLKLLFLRICANLQIRKKGFISNTYFGLKSYYLTDRR